MRSVDRPLLGLACAAMAACSVRGTDVAPVPPVAAMQFEAARDAALTSSPPVDAWWSTFGDDRVSGLVVQALTRSPDVREATALVRLARARLREQQGTNWPRGGVAAGEQHQRGPLTAADLDVFDAGLDASWEVDVFGARRASIQATRADLARERALRRSVLVSVAAEVVLAYADVRGTQARLQVARDNVANQERTFELTQRLLVAGRGTQLDVARAIAQLELTRASIPTLLAAESAAIYRLGVLVGSEPQTLAAELRVAQPPPRPPDVLAIGEPATLLRRRPDVAAAEAAVLAAAARAGVAAADLFPRLVLTGGLGFQAVRSAGMDGSSPRVGVGVGVTVPILEWNRIRQRILAADATAQATLAAYDRTTLLALEEAERAVSAYAHERQRFAHLERAAGAARTAAVLARQRFEFGVDNYLTVLDAERVRLIADDRLAQSQVQVTRLAAAIFKALGGGWSEAERLSSAQLVDDDEGRLREVLHVIKRAR